MNSNATVRGVTGLCFSVATESVSYVFWKCRTLDVTEYRLAAVWSLCDVSTRQI